MRVLLVLSSAADARRLGRVLKESTPERIVIAHEPRVSDALRRLRHERFDVVLVDPGPPDDRGLEDLRRVQERMHELPVVVLPARPAPEDARDRRAEPRYDGALLLETLRRAIERKHAERRSEFLAHHDALTGLPNRRLLLDRIGQAILRTRRGRRLLALLFVDLDEFKHINDAHGHAAGDRVLKAVAERLAARIRSSDTLARLGGDEFVIVLPELAHAGEAAGVAAKLIAALETPLALGDVEVGISASIGIGLYPEHGGTPEELLLSADQAMYEAKRSRGAMHAIASRDRPASIDRHSAARGAEAEDDARPRVAGVGGRRGEAESAARSPASDLAPERLDEIERLIAVLARRTEHGDDADGLRDAVERLARALEHLGRAREIARR